MERLDVQRDGFHVPPTANVDAALTVTAPGATRAEVERASSTSQCQQQQPLEDADADADELLASRRPS